MNGGTKGETRERALQGRKVVGSLGCIMNGRSVSIEVKRALKNTVIVPTLIYASKTWAWNESQRSRVHAVEINYLRSECQSINQREHTPGGALRRQPYDTKPEGSSG